VNTKRARVLVVDYEEDVLIALEQLLENEGFDTTTAWTGRDALKALSGTTFDLVLINEYLPDIDGNTFMQQLHAVAVPCIIMQPSRGMTGDLRSFRWPGAVQVVCKASPANVVAAVRTHQQHKSNE
jgi:DNA-binding response OmpR family regulator